MWNSAGEIPQIVFISIRNETLAVPINGRDPRRTIEDDRPFVRRVPVQFANASGCESHIYPGQLFRDRQFPNGHLPRPSAFVNALVRQRERILERWDQALGVGAGWPHGIRVLAVERRIAWARIATATVCGHCRRYPGDSQCRRPNSQESTPCELVTAD